MRIIISDPFTYGSSFDVAYVCIHCHWTNQNLSMMSLTSPVSYLSDPFSSYHVYFYLIYWNWCHLTKLYLFDYDPDDDGSGSGSPGTCIFPFFFDESVGGVGEFVSRVHGVSSGVFVLTGIESIGDVFLLVVFVPKGVESKGGQLIEIFCLSKY